jgi:hypothetical protein
MTRSHWFCVDWRSRRLARRERVGRFARDTAWDLVTAFAKGNWLILLGAMFLPIMVSLPLLLLEHETARWVTVGAAGISGPWLVAVMVIVMSGAADSMMGLVAEGWTADELRSLQTHGWRLANGIKIRAKADIDHLAVGPAGLLVVETKWSRHRWPLRDRGEGFMSNLLSDAVDQAVRNSKDVSTQFGKAIGDAPVRAVCVVWSAEESSDDDESSEGSGWVDYAGTVVVRGPTLRRWLQSLSGGALDEAGIDRVWKVIEEHAWKREEIDLKSPNPSRRTVPMAVLESFVAPFVGVVFAAYALIGIVRVNELWLDVVSALLFIVLGYTALRIPALRRAAYGWFGISVAFELIFLFFVIHPVR